jgi:hypothetical protein
MARRKPGDKALDPEPAPDSPLREKLQRLDELQEERQQLERLPALLAGTIDGSAYLTAPPPMPPVQQRVIEIETEMEQLRTEIEAEAEPAYSPHARSSRREGWSRCSSADMRQRDGAGEPEFARAAWPPTTSQSQPA